ncbi:hypothetical protein V493_08575 [Pseudogymnoascus sp. VKM F-4281 (FW-2241)]|nr:hypothetical protein V493_08575 [Pseudogymnoascus sp. VKM F-4281 (FW-2241)]
MPRPKEGGPGSTTFGTFEDLGLAIIGLGVEYPALELTPPDLRALAKRHYPDSPAMSKVMTINDYTGIDRRSSIGTINNSLVNMKNPPDIAELSNIFMKEGVALAVAASQEALIEARLDVSDITHIVSTTCTNSSNPGFDHYVCKQLGLSHTVEKVLHGIGCAGGLAALRTAANIAMGSSFRRRPARILVMALEICTFLVRSEMESIDKYQETRIGISLFSDCASSLVLSNGIGAECIEEPVYELLGWNHKVIPDTDRDLGFNVDPLGFKVILSPRVPKIAETAVEPIFRDLLSSVSDLPLSYSSPEAFDWVMHPGGATILSGVEKAMGITPEHMRASYDIYINHGNSSAATIISVMDRLRHKDMDTCAPDGKVKDYVVGCAFGPGMTVEMCMLKGNLSHQGGPPSTGVMTPPETEIEESRSDSEVEPGLSELLNGVELD